MRDFFNPYDQPIPMPQMNQGPMMSPAVSSPRSVLSPELLDLIASYNQPQEPSWEQILARRYIRALLDGEIPRERAYRSGGDFNVPQMEQWKASVPKDIQEMAEVSGTTPLELMEMMSNMYQRR